ncbi:MAG TPA: HD domain-containing protein [Bacillota bacterium]|nr:HD domain-containing protein [Bacillota bacterium]
MAYKDEQLHEVKVFKDPVHRYVRVVDRVIWDLIATKEFQRLRNIKQLGTTNVTFHGAEHSRFNHSLGVYEIVRRMVTNFKREEGWDHDEDLLCLCAALLHDLGHGPFSHSFEKVFNFDHEKFTQAIILGDTDVNKVLTRVEENFPEKVASVIAKTYENKLVVSLISSQIDADRMDYLQRDAYYTGVSYGHFDMERILRVMRPEKEEVVIKSTGMHAVEDYIMSRYQMYWQVYFHPVTRSAEVILMNIFMRANTLYHAGYPFALQPIHFQPFFEGDVSVDDFLALNEGIIQYYFQAWQQEEDPILNDLCSRFLERRLFKYIEYDPMVQEDDLFQLQVLFRKAGIDPDYYLAVDKSSDLPYDFYESEGGDRTPIYLQMPTMDLVELSKASTIVEAISRKKRTDHKLYYPLDFIEEIEDETLRNEIIDLLRKRGESHIHS